MVFGGPQKRAQAECSFRPRPIAASLTRLNFSVKKVIDGTFDDMRRALLQFGREAAAGPTNVIVVEEAQCTDTNISAISRELPLRSLVASGKLVSLTAWGPSCDFDLQLCSYLFCY